MRRGELVLSLHTRRRPQQLCECSPGKRKGVSCQRRVLSGLDQGRGRFPQ